MGNTSIIPLSSPKPPTSSATPDSPQTLPKTGPKLKYKPIFRLRKIAPTIEPVKVSEAKTTLEAKSSRDCSIPSSPGQLDTNFNKGTGYEYLYTKRERLTSAPRLRVTGEPQTSVLRVTPQDSANQKQCIKSDNRRTLEQVVISAQDEQALEMSSPTKTTEDAPQGFRDEVPDTKEQLDGIAEISPETKKIEVATAATGVKPTHQDSVIPITPPKAQRAIEPKPHGAATIFLPQFLAAWGVLNRAIDETIITIYANPVAGPATPLMILNSLGSTVIGAAIINANIQPKEIKAAIENMLLQYHHRRAKEAEDVARMLDFSGGTVEEEADASMGDTTDDDPKVYLEGMEGMDENLKIVSEAMEECAEDGETSEMDQSLSAMEITLTNGGSTLGSSETNGALAQDIRTQGSLETSNTSMDESAGLIITTEDVDLRGQEIWTISQPAMSSQYTNPANIDAPTSMEVSTEGNLLNANITSSLSDRGILGASMDLDVVEVYGVEPSNLHTDNSGDAREIYNTTEDSKIETFCVTGVSSDGEANEATFYFISNDVDSDRGQATAKESDDADDTFLTKETAQCQTVTGSTEQGEVTTTPCTIKESADHQNSPEIKGFGCGKPTDNVEELNCITSTHKTEEVSNCRKIGGMDKFNDINAMSNPRKLECINGFHGSEQVDVVKSSDAMEPHNLEYPQDAETRFVTSSETKTSNESSHLDSMTNTSHIKCLDNGIQMKAVPPSASINEADICECLRNTEDIGSDQNSGDTVETSNTSSLCIIERVGSIKNLNSNGDPDGTTAGNPDTTDKVSEKILRRADKVGNFCSTAEANKLVDPEEEDARQGLGTAGLGKFDLVACGWGSLCGSEKQSRSLSEERRVSRQDTSKNQYDVEQIQQPSAYAESEEDEDEGWANETPPCPTERRIWNWLAGLPEQSEVEEEIKMMEEMRKREEAKNYEKLTLMLESVEAKQKSWEGVFSLRSNQRIAPAVKTIPKLAAQVTAAPEVVVIPTTILEHRVWPTALLSIWISLMFFVGSWSAFLDLFRLFSPDTHLPDAPLSNFLLRLANFGLGLFHRIPNTLDGMDLQQLFLLVLVLWIFSRWSSGEAFGMGVARFIRETVTLVWGIFSLIVMVLMIIYTTAMDWIRYLTLARDGSTTFNQKIPYNTGLRNGGREIIILEEWSSSPGLEFEIGMDTYLWVGRTTEEAGVGESLVTLAQADTAMATPNLLVEQVCQRYTLGIGAGKAVADGSSGILYSSLGLCLASLVVWGRGNRRQLRWRHGRS